MASEIIQVIFNGLMSSLTLILISLGVTIFFGLMHIINFAHGELFMLGGYGAWWFLAKGFGDLGGSRILGYFVAMLISMVLVAVLGMLIERGPLRQWHGKLLGSFIVSMGFILIMQSGALVTFTGFDQRVPNPFPEVLSVAGTTMPVNRVVVILVSLVLIVALFLFFRRAKLGKAMRAIEQDRDAAVLQGVNYGTTCSWGMGIGCALAAAAGSLLGIVFYINPYAGELPVVKAFATVILGGMGSFGGTIMGGFIIGFIESIGGRYMGGDLAMMLVFAVVVVVLIVRPSGLHGHA